MSEVTLPAMATNGQSMTPEAAAQAVTDALRDQLLSQDDAVGSAFEARMVFESLPEQIPEASSWPPAARRAARDAAVKIAAEFRSAHQSYWTAEVAQAYKDALANLVIQPKATRGGGGGGASSRNSNSNNSSASTAEEGGMRGSQRSRGWWRMSGRRASLRGSIDGDAAGAGAGAGVGRDDIMVDMPDPSASAGDHGSSRRSSTDNVELGATAMRDWVSLREARVRELQAKYPRSGKSKHQLSLCRHDGRLHMTAGRGAFFGATHCCIICFSIASIVLAYTLPNLVMYPDQALPGHMVLIQELWSVASISILFTACMRFCTLINSDDDPMPLELVHAMALSCLAVGFTSLGCVRISQDDMWKQLLGVAELGYVGFIGMLWLEELRFSGVGVYMTDTYNHKDVTAYFKEADYKLKQVSPSKLMQTAAQLVNSRGRLVKPSKGGDTAVEFPWFTYPVDKSGNENIQLLTQSSHASSNGSPDECCYQLQLVDAGKTLWPPQTVVLAAILAKDRPFHDALRPRWLESDAAAVATSTWLYRRYVWARRLRVGFALLVCIASGVFRVLSVNSDVIPAHVAKYGPLGGFLGAVVGSALFIQMMFKQVLDSVPERDAWASGIMSEEVLSRYLATVLLPAGVNATWMMAAGLRVAITSNSAFGLNWAGYGVLMAGVLISALIFFHPLYTCCKPPMATQPLTPSSTTKKVQPVTWLRIWSRAKQAFVHAPQYTNLRKMYKVMLAMTFCWWPTVWLTCGSIAASQIVEAATVWYTLGVTGIVLLGVMVCCGCANCVMAKRVQNDSI